MAAENFGLTDAWLKEELRLGAQATTEAAQETDPLVLDPATGLVKVAKLPPATATTPGAMSAAQHILLSLGSKATGTIQCVAKASLTTGQTEIFDGANALTYRFPTSPGGALDVDISGATTAQEVAVALAAVINANSATLHKTAGVPVGGLITITDTRYGEVGNQAMQGTAGSTRIGMLGGRNPLSVSQGPRMIQQLIVVNQLASYSFPVDMSQFAELEIVGNGLTGGIYLELLADGAAGESQANYIQNNNAAAWVLNASNAYICLTGSGGTYTALNDSVICNLRSLSNGIWQFRASSFGKGCINNRTSVGHGTLPQGVASLTVAPVGGYLTAGGIWTLRGL